MRNHSYENDFYLHENDFYLHEKETACRTHIHMKGFALRLALKKRHKRTRKWPINVKLKCAVFILSNIFSHSDILNFETNLFPIVPSAKINSCKSFNLAPAAEIFVYCGFLAKR